MSPIVFGIKLYDKITTPNDSKLVCKYSKLAKAWIFGEENDPDALYIEDLTESERKELAQKMSEVLERSVNPSDIECWLLRSINAFYGHAINGRGLSYKIGWPCITPHWCIGECKKKCGYMYIWSPFEYRELEPGKSAVPFKNKIPKCWTDANLSVIKSDDRPCESEFALVGEYGYEYEDGKFDFNDLPTTAKKVADALMLPETDVDMYWSFSADDLYDL